MNPSIAANLLNPGALASLVIPSTPEDLLRFTNALLKGFRGHHLEQGGHTADIDVVDRTVLGLLEDIDELFEEGVGRLDHKAEFEDLALDGLLLDQWGAECLALHGVVEGILGTYAGEAKRGTCEGEPFRVKVCLD